MRQGLSATEFVLSSVIGETSFADMAEIERVARSLGPPT